MNGTGNRTGGFRVGNDNTFVLSRPQVSHRCFLDQGGYLIIPTTFEPGQESGFTLRVYSSKPLKLK